MCAGADKLDPSVLAGGSELRIFGEKTVSGMDSLGPAAARDLQNLFGVQIRLAGLSGADVKSTVNFTNMERLAVHVGKHAYRFNVHFPTSARNAHGDLAAIGNQNSPEHVSPHPGNR